MAVFDSDGVRVQRRSVPEEIGPMGPVDGGEVLPTGNSPGSRDGGVVPAFALFVVLAILATHLSLDMLTSGRVEAQRSADASALAGAAGGPDEAEHYATVNRVLGQSPEVVITVSADTIRACVAREVATILLGTRQVRACAAAVVEAGVVRLVR